MQLPPRLNLFMRKLYASAGDDGECWIWQFTTNGKYPTARLANRSVYAHRLSWELANGRPVPSHLEVCHACDTPLCVNPAHLWLGTRSDNIRDAWKKGRAVNPLMDALRAQTHCKRGHEFTAENTYYYRSKAGHTSRVCRQCSAMRQAKWRRPSAP